MTERALEHVKRLKEIADQDQTSITANLVNQVGRQRPVTVHPDRTVTESLPSHVIGREDIHFRVTDSDLEGEGFRLHHEAAIDKAAREIVILPKGPRYIVD